MTLDETEINRLRFEDLSESLQELINDLAAYDDLEYIEFRTKLANISNKVDAMSSIHVGTDIPKEISLGKTVYFDTDRSAVRIIDSTGEWVYLK